LRRYTKEGNLRLLVALIDAKADVNFESKVRRCRLTLLYETHVESAWN